MTESKNFLEGLLKKKLNEDGGEKARSYVEMPDILLPEEEVESGSSKARISERMRHLAQMGSIGMGTSSAGAGVRELGYAVSTAKNQSGSDRIDVKSIAQKADKITNVPRETARYLRASSSEVSPTLGPIKTPILEHTGRSLSLSSLGSQNDDSKTETKSESISPSSTSVKEVQQRSAESGGSAPKSPTFSTASSSSPSNKAPASPTKPQIVTSPSKYASTSSTTTFKSPTKSPVISSPPGGKMFSQKFDMNKTTLSTTSQTPKLVPLHNNKGTILASTLEEIEKKFANDPKRKYTLLQMHSCEFPDVDGKKKEESLVISDFVLSFGVDPDVFAKYPEWKKIELRKQAKLF